MMLMVIHTCRTDENSVYGRMLTAEWLITMSVILNRTPSVQGATGLPRMCTQPMGEVRGPLPWSCTRPYRICTKMWLVEEWQPLSDELP